MKKLQFQAAGVNYFKRAFTAAQVKVGDPIELSPDPTNSFDPYAIRLLKDHVMLAYVPRANNQTVLPYVKAGLATAVVNYAWPNGFYIEVTLKDTGADTAPLNTP